VTHIGGNAFSTHSGLSSIRVDANNPFYDSRNDCSAIIETASNTLIQGCQSTIIPNSITSIGNSAFSGCSSLTSIDIPNSVTSIGYWAFSGCTNLTSITIPNSVKSIEKRAFSGCTNLTSITIPNSVTSIGDFAFYDCTNLISIDIPNSVTSIGEWAFWRCSSLTSVTIGNSVTSIGEWAFSGCKSLIAIHSSIMVLDDIYIEEGAFEVININDCVLFVPSGTRWAYRHHPVFRRFKNIEIEVKKGK